MKRKIIDLDTFFNKKNTFEKNVVRQLTRFNTKEDKQKYLDGANMERTKLHITDDDYNLIREKKTSSVLYIQRLNDEITSKYNEFNQYKLDVLYDFEIMDQSKYDALETEIKALKQTRDDFIIKQKRMVTDETTKIDSIKLQIKERVEEFAESSKEEQKELYTQIITLKKDMFEIIKPTLSVVTIRPNTQIFDDMANVEFVTLVTDYIPIHNNEQNIANKDIEVGSEVELSPEELE
jgi:hypothetical protein